MNYFKNAKFFRCMALALLALTCFVGSNSVNAADGYAQKREMRSVWIATVFNIDWPKANHYGNPDLMKADLIAYFDACKTANLNSVCFQVRPMCDAFYKSSYEPWSSYLVARVAQIPVGIHWLLQCKRRTSAVCALMRGLIPTAIPRHQNSHGLVSHGAMQKMQKHASTYSPMEGSVSLTLPSSGQSTEL